MSSSVDSNDIGHPKAKRFGKIKWFLWKLHLSKIYHACVKMDKQSRLKHVRTNRFIPNHLNAS